MGHRDWTRDPALPGIRSQYRIVRDQGGFREASEDVWRLEVFRNQDAGGIDEHGRLGWGTGWVFGGRWKHRYAAEGKLEEGAIASAYHYRQALSGLSWSEFNFGSVDVASTGRRASHQRPPHTRPLAA